MKEADPANRRLCILNLSDGRKARIDLYWLVERFATVMAQLYDEQGDRGALLGERNRLIELGRRIGLRSFVVDDRPDGVSMGISIVDGKTNQSCFH